MKLKSYIAALHAALFAILLAVSPAGSGSLALLGAGPPAAAAGCSEATTFLARTSGLSGTETTAYTTMICGMVTDGVWSKLDTLYIFATNTTTTANLNLKSTSFTITTTGTAPSFTVDQGYTGAGGALDTTLVPASGGVNYVLNSAAIGTYVRNNRTTNANTTIMGIANSVEASIQLLNGGNAQLDLNEAGFPTTANTTTQGSWFLTRNAASGAGALILYKNGSSFASFTTASSSIPATCSFFILARSQTGSCVVGSAATDQVAAAWVGNGFNATEVTNFSSRLNAYMTAVGANVY